MPEIFMYLLASIILVVERFTFIRLCPKRIFNYKHNSLERTVYFIVLYNKLFDNTFYAKVL